MTKTAQAPGDVVAKQKYDYISADSHLEMPADCCAKWVPERYKEWIPKRVLLPDGGDGFVIKGSAPEVSKQSLFAGHSVEEFSPFGAKWEGVGTGGPKQRLAEQDADGVDAEVLYASPQFLTLCGTAITDVEAYNAMMRAWNDWLAQEYCAEAPDRLLGVGLIPVSNIDAALAELRHCKELGLPTVNLAAFPAGHRYPSEEDDRFWAAALETGMPLSVHVSMSAKDRSGEPAFKYLKMPMGYKWAGTDYVVRCARYGLRGALNAAQMIFHGVFDRFPDLRIYFAENQIGWLPLYLQQFDRQYDRSHHWAMREMGIPPLKRRPSEYIAEHCYWGFYDDPLGLQMLKTLNVLDVDRVMWSSDFPHLESAWPESVSGLQEDFRGLSEAEQKKIAAGNATEFFNLDGK
jgi:predicted TIM-barrel fold metal-dependent hydrolase